MKILTIDKKNFLKGLSTSKYLNDRGYSLDTDSAEATRKGSLYGLLQSGRSFADNSTNIADYVYATTVVKRTTQKAYSIGSGGKIYETTGFSSTIAHTVKHTETVKTYDSNSDIIMYNNGLYITSQTDIYYDDFGFATNDDNWWTGTKSKTALTSGVPHKMFVFQDKLYITDGNKLHEWDGSTASYSKLTLPVGFIINAVEIFNNQIYLGCALTSETIENTENKIFIWDSYTGDWIREIVVNTSTIRAFRELDGLLYFFAGSDLYVCDGYNYSLVRRSIGSPAWGATASLNGKLYFGGDDNTIFAYDPSLKCLEKVAKSNLGISVIFLPYSDHIYTFVLDIASSKSKLYKFSSNNAICTFYSDYFDFDAPINIKKIEVMFAVPLASGGSYNLYLYDEIDNELNNKAISFAVDGAIRKKSYWVTSQVDTFRLRLYMLSQPAGQAIRWIKVYYEPSERSNSK